jgi:hypothetical protein
VCPRWPDRTTSAEQFQLPPFATIQTPGVGSADVCAEAGGRHVDVGGCTNVATDVAVGVVVAGDEETAAQVAAGQAPCYTPSGQPYWTPGDAPCN